jgi:site-specific recombinase XerD
MDYQKLLPDLVDHAFAVKWLQRKQRERLANNTLLDYTRTLIDYTRFCHINDIDHTRATQEHIILYIDDLFKRVITMGSTIRQGVSAATCRKKLVPLRLYYEFLKVAGACENAPVLRGYYDAGNRYAKASRGLILEQPAEPWIPGLIQWKTIIAAMKVESPRNRLMLSLAYDGALRREELCSLQFRDINQEARVISIRAATTKTNRPRQVNFSSVTGQLLTKYLACRGGTINDTDALFLSESRRNRGKAISVYTWTKVIEAVAERTQLPRFTTHTLRHARLTDLARLGWELYAIARYAGHRNVETTLLYIHLSSTEINDRMAHTLRQN